MGRPKLLLPYQGDTVVGALVASLRQGGVSDIVLVTAPDDEPLRAWGDRAGLRLAVNPAPERGMLSSIREGLAAAGGADLLARSGRPLLVTPADLPALRPETVAALLRHGFRDGSTLLVPSYRGRRGHPLLVSPARLPEIETLDLAVGLRELLERHPDQVEKIAVEDPGILQDVDTPEDYAAVTPKEWI